MSACQALKHNKVLPPSLLLIPDLGQCPVVDAPTVLHVTLNLIQRLHKRTYVAFFPLMPMPNVLTFIHSSVCSPRPSHLILLKRSASFMHNMFTFRTPPQHNLSCLPTSSITHPLWSRCSLSVFILLKNVTDQKQEERREKKQVAPRKVGRCSQK